MAREAFLLALTVSAPILGIGLVVGVLISLFQAVTQLQEQTMTFVPKIVAMVLSAAFFVPWIANRMLEYARSMFGDSPW
jgi:flagellar biosynthetic protein FliQ